MKNIKIQIFGLLIACVMLPLQGMFSYSRMPRKKISQSMQSTGKQKIKRQYSQFSPEQPLQGAMGGVKYEDQESQSLWSKLKSLFAVKPLVPQAITSAEVNALLEPTQILAYDRNAQKPLLFFSQFDLARAQQALGYTINANPDAKNYAIEGEAALYNGKVNQLTILDKVLFHLSQIFSRKIIVASQSMLNYIALATFLTDLGADIGADNMDMHEDFFKRLTSSYRRFLKKREEAKMMGKETSLLDARIELLATVLQQLELILIKLIPTFKQEQQESQARYEKKVQQEEGKKILVEKAKALKREKQLKEEQPLREELEKIYAKPQYE